MLWERGADARGAGEAGVLRVMSYCVMRGLDPRIHHCAR